MIYQNLNRRKNDMHWISTLLIFFYFLSPMFASPDWIKRQIAGDLSCFRQDGFCQNCMLGYLKENKKEYYLCLFSIQSNKLHYEVDDIVISTPVSDRLWVIYSALSELIQKFRLPDVNFLVSLHDTLDYPCSIPIFVMSKKNEDKKILFPDFEALAERYQVIDQVNLEISDFPLPWIKRKDLLVWRGSGAQRGITPDNMNSKSRVILCQLGLEYPDLIDAGFTFHIPVCIEKYQKEFMCFEEIFSHKYQIWIDGNASSYSNSGWRLYTGSTVLKPDSPYTQWYYGDLQPWVHYVPIEEDLNDLVDKLLFLKENQNLAAQIAGNGLQFAREHITKEMNLIYLHDLLWAYSSSGSRLAFFPRKIKFDFVNFWASCPKVTIMSRFRKDLSIPSLLAHIHHLFSKIQDPRSLKRSDIPIIYHPMSGLAVFGLSVPRF